MEIQWQCKPFSDLTSKELYGILALRERVFIVEQNCIYIDCDGKDLESLHVFGMNDSGEICATSRIVPKGLSYENYVSIGRVCVDLSVRRFKVGYQLMEVTIEHLQNIYGSVPIKISAQSYLIQFYQKFGFQSVGEEYLEDDIPHTAMIRS